MGARPEDYRKVAPPHSFIHVDEFESPRHLAEYLTMLDKNDDLYNVYFRWKGTGEFVNGKFWCRLCSLVHVAQDNPESRYVTSYSDAQTWWYNLDTCVLPTLHRTAPNVTRKWSTWRRDDSMPEG